MKVGNGMYLLFKFICFCLYKTDESFMNSRSHTTNLPVILAENQSDFFKLETLTLIHIRA